MPKEDKGNFFILMQSAEGSSFESNAANLKKIESILLPYTATGEAERIIVRTPGFGGTAGIAIVGTAIGPDKKGSTFDLMDEISGKLVNIPDVTAFAVMRSGIGGRGLGRPVQFVLQGNTYEELVAWRDIVLTKARENPNLVRIDSDYKEVMFKRISEHSSIMVQFDHFSDGKRHYKYNTLNFTEAYNQNCK